MRHCGDYALGHISCNDENDDADEDSGDREREKEEREGWRCFHFLAAVFGISWLYSGSNCVFIYFFLCIRFELSGCESATMHLLIQQVCFFTPAATIRIDRKRKLIAHGLHFSEGEKEVWFLEEAVVTVIALYWWAFCRAGGREGESGGVWSQAPSLGLGGMQSCVSGWSVSGREISSQFFATP